MHQRILSIDVLRGWNMWWLIGGADVIRALAVAVPCGLTATLAAQTHHAGLGFYHHDIIFPLFLFLAGASWPFSRARSSPTAGCPEGRRCCGFSAGRLRAVWAPA